MELSKYFFEALKTRLENILRSVSGNRKSYIVWGSTTATDVANKVVLTPGAEIVPGVPASLAELLVFYKACTAHEGAHIKYTSKKDWEKACARGPAFQHLTNIIEDGRIEAAISRDLPGAGRWLRFTNSYIYRNRATWGEGVAAFLMGLTAYAVGGRIPDVDPEIKRRIKLAAPWVDIGKASPDTEGVLTCVEEILKIPDIKELFHMETPPPPKDERASDQPQKSEPDQKTKDRAEKAREVLKKRAGSETDKSSEESTSADGTPDESVSAGDNSDESTSENPLEAGDAGENPPEDEPADETGAQSKGSPESSPAEDDSGNNENAEEELSNPSTSGRESDDDRKSGDDQELGDNADSATGGALEDFISSEDGAGTPGGSPESPDGSLEDDYFDPPDEEDEDDFKSLLESSEDEVLSITKDAESLENDDRHFDPTEGVATGIHSEIKLRFIEVRKDRLGYKEMKDRNHPVIKGLVNEIRVALDSRKAYDLRGLNKGRLHSGSLWKLAVPDPGVFSKRHIPGDIPELAAYILIDLSGSMTSITDYRMRVDHAKDAACVISEACRELKIPHAITGFNEPFHRTTVVHYPAVTFEDVDSAKIPSLRADGNNRDGYSIRVAANELALRHEPRKILFVLSDGLPSASGYGGKAAYQDVRDAVLEARKKGIRTISLRFGETSNEPEFRFMYDTPVFVHDISTLPRTLGSVFKKVLLE